MRKPVIGVMGGGTVSAAVEELAEELGRLIAAEGWILLNGGRDAGVMAASARGAAGAGGMVIGVLPDADDQRASPHLDIAIMTAMADARNLINVLSSDVVIACPGAAGTLTEIAMALRNNRPLIILGWDTGLDLEALAGSGRWAKVDDPREAVSQAKDWLNSA